MSRFPQEPTRAQEERANARAEKLEAHARASTPAPFAGGDQDAARREQRRLECDAAGKRLAEAAGANDAWAEYAEDVADLVTRTGLTPLQVEKVLAELDSFDVQR